MERGFGFSMWRWRPSILRCCWGVPSPGSRASVFLPRFPLPTCTGDPPNCIPSQGLGALHRQFLAKCAHLPGTHIHTDTQRRGDTDTQTESWSFSCFFVGCDFFPGVICVFLQIARSIGWLFCLNPARTSTPLAHWTTWCCP